MDIDLTEYAEVVEIGRQAAEQGLTRADVIYPAGTWQRAAWFRGFAMYVAAVPA
jgi:hypothetical protein